MIWFYFKYSMSWHKHDFIFAVIKSTVFLSNNGRLGIVFKQHTVSRH